MSTPEEEVRDDPVAGLMVTGGNMAFLAWLVATEPLGGTVPDWFQVAQVPVALGFTYMFYRGVRAMGANALLSVIGTGVLTGAAIVAGEALGEDSPGANAEIERVAEADRSPSDSASGAVAGNDGGSFGPVLTRTAHPKPEKKPNIRIDSNTAYEIQWTASNAYGLPPMGTDRAKVCGDTMRRVQAIFGKDITMAPDCECTGTPSGINDPFWKGQTVYGCNIAFSYFVEGEEAAQSARARIQKRMDERARRQARNNQPAPPVQIGSGSVVR